MIKTLSLPKNIKTLLVSLAVSDLGVGLIVQPLLITSFVIELAEPNLENNSSYKATLKAYRISMYLLSYASFFGVTALTVDRFLAIHLHLRYQELVTHKRVVAVVISISVLSAILSLIRQLVPRRDNTFAIFATLQFVCLITTAVLFGKIYLTVRHHANQIHALQVQQEVQNNKMANAARLRKSAIATFYVYLVFFVCYLPRTCIFAVSSILTAYSLQRWHYYSCVCQFITQSSDLLLEDETYSTLYHEHTAENIVCNYLKLKREVKLIWIFFLYFDIFLIFYCHYF